MVTCTQIVSELAKEPIGVISMKIGGGDLADLLCLILAGREQQGRGALV